MTPQIQIALLIGQALLRYGPAVAREIARIFGKVEITAADWDTVFALAEKPYDHYINPPTILGPGCDGPDCDLPKL